MIHRVGERAFLIDRDGTAAVLALRSALLATPLAGQVDVVAGARTVLVRMDRPWSEHRMRAQLDRLESAPIASPDGPPVEIEVVYDGADLADVGAVTGLGGDGIVAAHTATSWRVAFSGFAPGFGYLVPDGELPWPPVARRAASRPRIPAGSVGLAGEFSGVYPRASPGGWQLIGRTAVSLWRLDRDPSALLTPGIGVRFRAVTSLPEPAVDVPRPVPAPSAGLLLHRPGLLCLIQDRGRPGRSDLGVSTSGAADRAAAARANALVGNPPGAAVLEFVLGGFEIEARGAQLVAVTGAPVGAAMDRALQLEDGRRLIASRPTDGLRSYLAVAGGIDVPAVLGSRSADVLSGLGPAPVRAGDLLPVGVLRGTPVGTDVRSPEPADGPFTLIRGPRHDWFTADALDALVRAPFTVTPDSNRVGLRLSGPPLPRARSEELPSEGLVRGSLQIPPSGEPVLFLADHPVTGGYPVVAVLTDADADRAAQLRPGSTLRFRWGQ